MKEYEESPTFDKYYEKIVQLIRSADYVIGHSMDGDSKALNEDCIRYNLPSIDYVFYDIKIFYKAFKNIKIDVSVTNIMKDLNAQGDEREHDAEADAFNTMADLKKMLDDLNLPLSDLIVLCPKARNKNENYEVESIVINNLIREEEFQKLGTDGDNNTLKRYSKNGRLFIQFLDNVQPTEKCNQDLKGQSISISINYEENHFRQMLNIVQMICNHGGTYVMKASLGTIFVPYPVVNEDGTEKYCSKSKYVKEANENGGNIKEMSFQEFLDVLNITEQQLDNLPMVSFDCLCREDAVIKDRRTASIVRGKQKVIKTKKDDNNYNKYDSITIGDLMKEMNIKGD